MIEAGFGGGDVGDIGGVGFTAFRGSGGLRNEGGSKAEFPVGRAHPFGVAFGEVIIGGYDVNAVACLCEHGRGGHGGKCFAFAGFHFDDAPAQERLGTLDLGGKEI